MISSAYAQAVGAAPQGDATMSILMMVGMVVLFYFILIRPQSKRAKEHKAMIEALKKGDEIITGGGIAGKIIEIGDAMILVEIDDNVKIKIQKQAVVAHLPPGSIKAL